MQHQRERDPGVKTTQVEVCMATSGLCMQLPTIPHKGRLLTNGNYAPWLKSRAMHKQLLISTRDSSLLRVYLLLIFALINFCKKKTV